MRRESKTLDVYEQNIIINSLVEWRNARIREGKCTDAIDDILLKLCKSKKKRIKI